MGVLLEFTRHLARNLLSQATMFHGILGGSLPYVLKVSNISIDETSVSEWKLKNHCSQKDNQNESGMSCIR